MRVLPPLVVLLTLGLLLATGGSVELEQEGNVAEAVLDLTPENFTSVVHDGASRVLVFYYVPWCAFCQRLHPEFRKAAEEMLKQRERDASLVGKFARVDAEAHSPLATQQGVTAVKGYPALYWYTEGKAIPYVGGRTHEDLLDFVLTRGAPLVRDLSSEDDATNFTLSYTVAVVARLPHGRDGSSARALQSLEAVCRTNDLRCAQLSGGAERAPTAGIYRSTDDAYVQYPGSLADDDPALFRRFVEAHALPPVVGFGPTTHKALLDSTIDAIAFLFLGRSQERRDANVAWLAAFQGAASSFLGEALFTTVAPAAFQNHQVHAFFTLPLKFFGLPADRAALPALTVYRKRAHARYVLTPDAATVAWSVLHDGSATSAPDPSASWPPRQCPLADFVRRALTSEMTPLLRSEPAAFTLSEPAAALSSSWLVGRMRRP